MAGHAGLQSEDTSVMDEKVSSGALQGGLHFADPYHKLTPDGKVVHVSDTASEMLNKMYNE